MSSHNTHLPDPSDVYIRRVLKNWIAKQPLPPLGEKARLLQAVASTPNPSSKGMVLRLAILHMIRRLKLLETLSILFSLQPVMSSISTDHAYLKTSGDTYGMARLRLFNTYLEGVEIFCMMG